MAIKGLELQSAEWLAFDANTSSLFTFPACPDCLTSSCLCHQTAQQMISVVVVAECNADTHSSNLVDAVFISHTGQDAYVDQLVSDLHGELISQRVPAFFDAASIPKGDHWRRTILKWVRRCKVVVVVLSPNFPARRWPMAEVSLILSNAKGRTILPVLFGVARQDLSNPGSTALGTKWAKSWKQNQIVDPAGSGLNPTELLKALMEHQMTDLSYLICAGQPAKGSIKKAAAALSEDVRKNL